MPIINTPRHLQEGPTPRQGHYYLLPGERHRPSIAAGTFEEGHIEALPATQKCLHCRRSFHFTGPRPVCLKCRMEGKS